MIEKIIKELENKKIAILGFGMEGISSYHFIRRYSNIPLTIIDKVNPLNKMASLSDDKGVTLIYGDNYLENLEQYDLVIKSPGVITKDINCEKINFTSQLEFLLKYNRQNVIGITATKGKSTTSTLLYEVIKACHKDVVLLGNIGKPIFAALEAINNDTLVVVEMSALQLEFVKHSPHIAAIINLYEDHLDHSGTVEHYHANKLNIFKYQDSDDYALYSSDIEPLNSYIGKQYLAHKYAITFNAKQEKDTTYLYDDKVYLNDQMLYDLKNPRHLLGDHNVRNIMFVLTVAHLLHLDMSLVWQATNDFKGLEHRLEYVGKYHDILYYNDAISTIPEATINAIKTLKEVDTLIIGGMDRGIDYQELINYLNTGAVNNLICMPTTGYKIGDMITNSDVHVYRCPTLDDAVKKAKLITEKNKICLLSPAASSYEYFKNFEEKGTAFKKMVKED